MKGLNKKRIGYFTKNMNSYLEKGSEKTDPLCGTGNVWK